MPFDYRKAELEPGRTVPMVLDMLPGSPEIQVEHLGDENRTYLADHIAKANAKASRSGGVAARKMVSKATIAEDQKQRRTDVAKHVVRDLKAKHTDGRDATPTDIPEWVDSLPNHVVMMIYLFALNAGNFLDQVIEGDVKELAEK